MILVVSDSLVYIKRHFKPVNNKPAWDGRINGYSIRLLLKYSAPEITVQFDNQAEYEAGVENIKGIFFV